MEDIFIGGKNGEESSGSGDIYIGGKHKPQPIYEPEDDFFGDIPEFSQDDETGYRQSFVGNPQQEPLPPEPDGNKPGRAKKEEKKKSKKSLFKRIRNLIITALILLGILTGTVFFTFCSVNYNETGHGENVFLDEEELMHSTSVKNIMLIGVDRRTSDESSRSDTMLMVSLNTATKKIKLTSFMRDTYVYIPEKQKNTKLNAACAWGGAQMVMDTVEYNFNIRIDHYVLVDFTMFEDIIDGLGGVEVEVSEAEAKYMRNRVHLENVQAGEAEHLNGKEALWYCRIRELDSDFMRTQRQRKVLTALIEKVKHTNPLKLYQLMGDIISLTETDMSPATLTSLAMNGLFRYLHYDIEQGSVPAEGTWKNKTISGQAVLSADLEANQKYLEEFIFE